MLHRPRIRHTLSFNQRLGDLAKRLRAEAAKMPPGKAQDDLLSRARQAETAIGINTWLSSTGQKPPDLDPQVLERMGMGDLDAGLSDSTGKAASIGSGGGTNPGPREP